jgi:hypothetical protein
MDLLNAVNEALTPIEKRIAHYQHNGDHPFYFVVGAPRSGTTLLTQCLVYCYDFGYITNVAARFFSCPAVGIRMSKEILGEDYKPSFYSHHARTSTPWDIHEYGKFWMYHLCLLNSADVTKNFYNHFGLNEALFRITSEFDKPMVMKGIFPAYDPRILTVPHKFINIERDPLDCCVSIYKIRKNSDDPDKWFGWHIPVEDRANFYELDIRWQIAHQVHYFQQYYRRIAHHTITLYDLCMMRENAFEDFIPEPLKRKLPDGALTFTTYRDEVREPFREILERVVCLP